MGIISLYMVYDLFGVLYVAGERRLFARVTWMTLNLSLRARSYIMLAMDAGMCGSVRVGNISLSLALALAVGVLQEIGLLSACCTAVAASSSINSNRFYAVFFIFTLATVAVAASSGCNVYL